jgi:hypothetical protein
LKPCPWCNETPSLIEDVSPQGEQVFKVECVGVPCRVNPNTQWASYPERAEQMWNTSIPDASLAADLEKSAQYLESAGDDTLDEARNTSWLTASRIEALEKYAADCKDLAARLRAHSKRIGGDTK